MRILLLNQFYLPDTAATGQLLADVARELAGRGHDVHVVCSRARYGGGSRRFPAEQVIDGVNIHRVGAFGFGRAGWVGRLLDYLSFYLLAFFRIRRLRPIDVCLSLTTPPFIGLVMVPYIRREETVMVNWMMDLYPEIAVALGFVRKEATLHRLLKRAANTIYNHSAVVVALGNCMAAALRRAGVDPDKIRIVQNWVPARAVRYNSPAASDGEVTLMYHGNLGLGHQLDSAVRAVSKLEENAALEVRMVGDGKMRVPLQRLTEQLGLNNIRFDPPCPLSELSDSLAGGDIHLISQRPGTEGLLVPSKLYSILAAGRPSIYIGPEGTEVASVIKESRSGILVEAGDVDGIADAIKQLADGTELRLTMGERARQYYDEQFGEAGNAALIADVVESAVTSGTNE